MNLGGKMHQLPAALIDAGAAGSAACTCALRLARYA